MSKITFQRLIAILMIISVVFIDIPGVFKDTIIILLSLAFFFSTLNFIRVKKEESTNL